MAEANPTPPPDAIEIAVRVQLCISGRLSYLSAAMSFLTFSVGGMSWEPVLEAVGQAVNGRSEAAKAALEKCWDETVEEDHAQRCVLAHYLADQQENLQSETRWDEQALTEFTYLQDGDLAAIGVPSTAGFAPSLHLTSVMITCALGASKTPKIRLYGRSNLSHDCPSRGMAR